MGKLLKILGLLITYNITLHTASIPAVNQPRLISKGPTWVQIGWESLDCDGGYQIDSHDVEYGVSRRFYSPIYTIAARVSSLNYTIRGLSSSTLYYFRVRTVSSVSSITSPSSALPVTTQVSGKGCRDGSDKNCRNKEASMQQNRDHATIITCITHIVGIVNSSNVCTYDNFRFTHPFFDPLLIQVHLHLVV